MRLSLLAPQELKAPHKTLEVWISQPSLSLSINLTRLCLRLAGSRKGCQSIKWPFTVNCSLVFLSVRKPTRILCARVDSRVTGMVITASIASGSQLRQSGHAFRSAHDVIQNQFARELRCLSLCISDNDTKMRRSHSHLATQKRGVIALIGTPAFPTVYNPVSRLYRSDIIIDVKLV